MASGTFLMVATVAVLSSYQAEPSSITSVQQVVSGGFAVDEKCNKVAEAFHSGNGPVNVRGNKSVSRYKVSIYKVIETTTFCVEL